MAPNTHKSTRKDFSHFLLTRFNAVWRVGGAPKLDWLIHRFELFEQFCYPSVRAQSNQNFRWLVLFDVHTPPEFKSKIQEYSAWENFIPLYLEKYDLELVRERILSLINTPGHLITTRLDNDDALCRNYIEIIQNNFFAQDLEFLNLRHGYVWHRHKIYATRLLSNPFISLIEKVEPSVMTVWCGDHPRLSQFGPIRQIQAEPAWLQVVHERNLCNSVQGVRQPIRKLNNRFAIRPAGDPPKENAFLCRVDQARGYFKRTRKVVVRKLKHTFNNSLAP